MNRQKYPPKLRRAALRSACLMTWRGVREKLPVFVVATIAGISLSVLDRAKTKYDAAKNSSIEINDDFIKASEKESARFQNRVNVMRLLKDPYNFKYQRFASPEELLSTLATKAAAEDAEQLKKFEAKRREQGENLDRTLTTLETNEKAAKDKLDALDKQEEILAALPAKNRDTRLKKLEAQREGLNEQRADIARQRKSAQGDFQNFRKANDEDIAALLQQTGDKVDSIHHDFGGVLPEILSNIQTRPVLSDYLLKPFLDERTSVYVVYQIFKITALIILVLSFVFVFVMALRRLPLANSSETLADKLQGLIGSGQSGASHDVARAAVLSVAALGVGTAAVVAGNSIDRAISTPGIAIAGATSPIPADPFYRNAYYSLHNAPRNSNQSYLTNVATEQPTPDYKFSPTNKIDLPEPVVKILTVPDRAGTALLSNHLDTLNTKVQQMGGDVADMKQSAMQMRMDVSDFKRDFPKTFASEADKLDLKLGDIGGTLTQISTNNSQWNTTYSQTVGETNKKLDLINGSFDAARREALVRQQKSDGRNFLTRAGQFFGSEHFVVSEQSYDALAALLPKDQEHKVILDGLEQLKSQPPAGKGTFLSRLREETLKAAHNNKAALDTLKLWENTILSYTRLPR
jgi:hypothetical protein